jgi:two-component system sensor histidine kinase/response regulator
MASETEFSGDPPIILFVDDNPALLRSVDLLLRMEGYRVMLAADGEEALELLENADSLPHLIISDVAMPKMDGFALFRAVRAHDAWIDIPFLFLTARDQMDDLRQGYSLGADDYLVKPLDQERLLMIISSKLKRRAELLGHIQSQQLALDTAKRELAQMVSHELRTPLVSISMVSEILARGLDQMEADQIQTMLDSMQSGSARLTRLVEQMVMFVQLQSGALVDSIRRQQRLSSVHDLVIEAVERARRFDYRQSSVPVTFEELGPEVQVQGDFGALVHALAEIATNAIAFSPSGGTVVIRQWLTDNHVWIALIDSGPGIPAAERDRVFEPYQQVNRRRYEQQGIGIGLPLAKGIIEAHGGSLMLESIPGRGTEVTVGLPFSDAV